MILGLDIGGHHVAAARVSGARIEPGSFLHRDVASGADADAILSAWAGAIDERAGADVTGIGIAMPGPFDYRTGVAWFEGNAKFGALYGVDVGAALGRRMARPLPIRFLNDATAFAVGVHAMGAGGNSGGGAARLVAATLGTGMGSAFLEDGVPVIAARAGAVPPHGSLWHMPWGGGIVDDAVSARWLLAAGRTAAGRDFDGVAALADRARSDAALRAVFDRYGATLGAVLGPWARGFGAGAIVLGGRITGAHDLFGPALATALGAAGVDVPVTIHADTEDAAIVGAARAFDEEFWAVARERLPGR